MRRTVVLHAVMAAVVLVVAAPAGAATLRGSVLGAPQKAGKYVRVPLLLDAATAKRFRVASGQALITVPKVGFRSAEGRTATPGALRLGDTVSGRVRVLKRGRGRAATLRIVHPSAAPRFDDLEAKLAAASAGAKKAADEVARIAAAEKDGAAAIPDPGALRSYLLDVRTQLNLIISDLRAQALGLDAVGKGSRAQGDATLRQRIATAAADARSAAKKLEDGVAGLDEFINSIGAINNAPLPPEVTSALHTLLATVQGVIGQLPASPVPLPALPPPPV